MNDNFDVNLSPTEIEVNLGVNDIELDIPGGARGLKGDQGDAAGFAEPIANATTLSPGSSATASVTASGDPKNKLFEFEFGIPKGQKGDTGDSGVWVGEDEPTDPDYNVWVDPNGETFTEKDPLFSNSPAYGIETTDITNWDSKSVVSGTDDGNNWTSLTIDGTTKGLASGGGGAWGSITGTLSNQTDLQNELNDKVSEVVRFPFAGKTNMASINDRLGYIEMQASYYGSDGGTYSIFQMQPGTFNAHKYTSYTEKGSLEIDDNGTTITGIVTPTTNDMPTNKDYVDTGLSSKQDSLVSGTNIKTINNYSVLGSGDLSVGDALPIGTEVEYNGATVPNGWEQIDDKAKILWENPNPSASSFGSQQITLNSDDYEYYEVVVNWNLLVNRTQSSGKVLKGSGCVFNFTSSASYYRTLNYVSDTTLQVSDAITHYFSNNTDVTDNEWFIPLYVIGYKTGLFS